MLELLFKGLLQWLFDMVIHITEYLADSLLAIFTMDLAYFETAVPITGDIFNIITCLGWALLLGNLVFQSAKAMLAGLGFEGEAPQSLFARTFVMTFFPAGLRHRLRHHKAHDGTTGNAGNRTGAGADENYVPCAGRRRLAACHHCGRDTGRTDRQAVF